MTRSSGRAAADLRPVTLEPGVSLHAEGSCLAKFGNTHVLCTASVEDRVPHFLRNSGRGWVTAEYGMLPRSTHSRTDREAARGKQGGRTLEIQRLIGRALRSVTDLEALGEHQIKLDCDVIQADGGTRGRDHRRLGGASDRLRENASFRHGDAQPMTTMSPPFPVVSGRAFPLPTSIMPRTAAPRSMPISCSAVMAALLKFRAPARSDPSAAMS